MNPSGPLNNPDPRQAVASSSREVTGLINKANVSGAQAKRRSGDQRSVAVLLDLSGDKKASTEWAATQLAQSDVKPIEKAGLKWTSKREALAHVRALRPDIFGLFTPDLNLQSGLAALMLFAVFAGARAVVIGDRHGRNVSRSRLSVLVLQGPRFFLELLAGYVLLVPLSWLLTEVLRISLTFRGPIRATRAKKKTFPTNKDGSLSALYIRATLASAAEGGMRTHVAGFASGTAALGHRLNFLTSGSQSTEGGVSIAPALTFSATRVLFELWNNLAFTLNTLRLISRDASQSSDIDFIYQRYSRFNWTGVALSLVTGIPLALEYNGSEVWVGRQWDPIGQLWLLKRFERLNQRAADLIFVVSDVERRNLRRAYVSPARIVVNPNGVDPDRFRPGCGGREIRSALGVEDKKVVGFVGTFGPWHGAPVLAEAARVLATSGIHFLFIGDGDQRAQTESIIKSAAASATFAGRISHHDVPGYLDACDILVSPHVPSADGSEFFGSPTKLFEYLAMGKGLVASRLGQIADVVVDGENGMLVEPGDVNGLARAIETLAQDDALRQRLGVVARKTVIDRYTWKDNARRVFDAMRNRTGL